MNPAALALRGEWRSVLLLTYDGAYYQLMNDVPTRRRLFLPYHCEINIPATGRFTITTSGGWRPPLIRRPLEQTAAVLEYHRCCRDIR